LSSRTGLPALNAVQGPCPELAHHDLASRIHVGNAAESGKTRTNANNPQQTPPRGVHEATRQGAWPSDIGLLQCFGRMAIRKRHKMATSRPSDALCTSTLRALR